ncbi:tRNA pseudouridine(55) synthase TruB [Candidatus Saccharibacteria bacterium]|nr:tRNA pseudouridine(55) synthase TruB [Candidatus Saccharibacteria bacterium]
MQIKEGILLINKPRGRSSFSMVAQVRRISGVKRVGHAGTLDPEAEGLLIVLVGKEYTKKSDSFLKLDKTYEFTIRLGQSSTTGDKEGEKTAISSDKPTEKAILNVLQGLQGELKQVPPIYSAIKVNGQRAYKLAAKGQKPDLEAREITIYSLELLDYTYPQLKLRAEVSSGTYIRVLGETIGMQLGTGAYCTEIIRTKIGKYDLKNAIILD